MTQGMMGMNNMQHNGMGDGMNGMNNGMQVIFVIIIRTKRMIIYISYISYMYDHQQMIGKFTIIKHKYEHCDHSFHPTR